MSKHIPNYGSTYTGEIRLLSSLDNQGGGHGAIVKCELVSEKKQCIAKKINHREGQSYYLLAETPLKDYIPKFYGNHTIDGVEYIVIEDLTSGFKSPCVSDYKVGTRHYDLKAPPEKVKYLTSKQVNSTTESNGVRIIDSCVRKEGEKIFHCDKHVGIKISIDELRNKIGIFLPTKHLRTVFIEKLEKFNAALEETKQKYPGFRLYASSILVVYDGDEDPEKAELRLKLIDFAHLYIDIRKETDKVDESLEDGVLFGCKSLLKLAKEL